MRTSGSRRIPHTIVRELEIGDFKKAEALDLNSYDQELLPFFAF
jgi:hypothetical protein